MSDKSKGKKYQRVINKLMIEMNADRQGEPVLIGNIISCIKILNNTIDIPEFKFKEPKVKVPDSVMTNRAGGNA